MPVIFDDIIFSLQNAGGISEVWSQIAGNYPDKALHIIYDDARNNLLFKKNKNHVYKIYSSRGIVLKRYLNPYVRTDKKFIFHSSYFRICRNRNAINVTTVHDFVYEYYRNDIKAILHKIQKKRAVMNSDAVICVSNNTLADFKKFYPQYKGMIKVIHNGYKADTYFFKDRPRENTILFVGSRVSYKRFDIAVRLAGMLKDYRLIIVGGGKLTADEERLLSELPKGKHEVVGFVDNDKLAELYNTSKFLCYPSEYEGFGIPLIEAQACGCIPVYQDNPVSEEVLNGTGIAINAGDIKAAAEKIEKELDDMSLDKLRREGFKNVKKFSWEKCRRETYEYYDEILRKYE